MALISPSLKLNFKDLEIPNTSNVRSNLLLSAPSLPFKIPRNYPSYSWKAQISTGRSRSIARASSEMLSFDSDDDETSSPWEGAIVYKRDPTISHLEYCTTLERLGLAKLSSKLSRSRASVMGLRVTSSIKDFPLGTPVLVSIDVTRKKGKLRLDGILRTVIELSCYRCGEPAAECIFSNFALLLTEEPPEEPDKIYVSTSSLEVDDDDSVDLDDQLYFPAKDKEVDLSKNIRDLVHIEITLNAICDPSCKGLCLECGMNLNEGPCNCSKQKVQGKNVVFS